MRQGARESIGWATAMAAALIAGWAAGSQFDQATSRKHEPRDWITFLGRLYTRISDHRVTAIAGGVTSFVLLALFPATAALVSIYGLAADTSALGQQLELMAGILPQSAIDIIGEQLTRVIEQQSATLGFAFLTGVALSLWSANAGMKALFDALNIIHDETEKRGFFMLNAVSLAFTVGLIAFFIVAVSAIVVLPVALSATGIGAGGGQTVVDLARWPLLFVAIALVLSLIYRFGPSCSNARWRLITPGSAAAAFGWIVASMAFSWYAANFGQFNKTYGTLGAAVGFMIWNWIVTVVILVGAEIDAERDRESLAPPGQECRADPETDLVRPRTSSTSAE